MSEKTQNQQVLSHLKKRSITSAEALYLYGIARLASRINDLKNAGYRIDAKREEVVNRSGKKVFVARYFLLASKIAVC